MNFILEKENQIIKFVSFCISSFKVKSSYEIQKFNEIEFHLRSSNLMKFKKS